MGMAREDELVQAEVVIFGDALCHLLVTANERRPCSGADQANTRPEVRTDLELAPVSAVQREHPLLPDRLALREKLLGGRDESGIHCVQEPTRLLPCLALSVASDHVEADAEAKVPAFALRRRPYPFDALAPHVGRLAAQQIHVDMTRGVVLSRTART